MAVRNVLPPYCYKTAPFTEPADPGEQSSLRPRGTKPTLQMEKSRSTGRKELIEISFPPQPAPPTCIAPPWNPFLSFSLYSLITGAKGITLSLGLPQPLQDAFWVEGKKQSTLHIVWCGVGGYLGGKMIFDNWISDLSTGGCLC